jgi:hypothetical protein
MNHAIHSISLLVALALPAPGAMAEPVPVENPGFEERPIESDEQGGYYVSGPNGEVPGNLKGWLHPQWANVRVQNLDGGESSVAGGEGRQFLLLYPWVETKGEQVDGSQVWQILSETVQPGTYKLTVSIGYAAKLWQVKADARFSLETSNGDPKNPVFTKLASCTVNLEERWRNHEQPKDVLEDFFLEVDIPAGSLRIGEQLVIRLASNPNGNTDDNVAYDNVRLDFKPLP